jgi:hypothetical protein
MPLEQIQRFLGYAKLETPQSYAETTPEMIEATYQKALALWRNRPPRCDISSDRWGAIAIGPLRKKAREMGP